MRLSYFLIFSLLISTVIAAAGTPYDSSGEVPTYISQFARNNSDYDMIVNCSGTPCIFKIQPNVTEVYRIARVIIHIEGSNNPDGDSYGPINGGLTNGVVLRVMRGDNLLLNLTPDEPIKNNADFSHYAYDVVTSTFDVGTNFIVVRWTFAKGGTYIRLNGSKNDSIQVVLRDDHSSIGEQHWLFQGYIEQSINSSDTQELQSIDGGINMIAPAILMIGLMFFLGMMAFKVQEFKEDGSIIKSAAIAKSFLVIMSLYIGYLTTQLAFGISIANGFSDSINTVLKTHYITGMWFYLIFAMIIFMTVMWNLIISIYNGAVADATGRKQ